MRLQENIHRAQILAAAGADAGDEHCITFAEVLDDHVRGLKVIFKQTRENVSQLLIFANTAFGLTLLAALCGPELAAPAVASGAISISLAECVFKKIIDRNSVQSNIEQIAAVIEDYLADMAAGDLTLRQDLADRQIEYSSLVSSRLSDA